MKKTLSIHLGKQLFVIEEDAYNRLHHYLQRLEQSFQAEDGVQDIMEDIEMRCAELILSFLSQPNAVVTMKEIQLVIESLGEPEVISENTSQEQPKSSSSQSKAEKRLFRDTDEGMIGGVATGLATYLNIDPVIVRILFVCFMFLGFGVLLYIILWVVIPNVKSPADRLQLRGKAVTVDTIKEEIERTAERLTREGKEVAEKYKNPNSHLAQQAKRSISIVSKLLGIGFLGFTFLFTIVYLLLITGMVDVFPVSGDEDYTTLYQTLSLFCEPNRGLDLVWYAIVSGGIGSILVGFSLGIRLILGKKNAYLRAASFTGFGIIGIALISGVFGGIQTARDYTTYQQLDNQEITIHAASLNIEKAPQYFQNKPVTDGGGIDFIRIENNRIFNEGIKITKLPSRDTSFHVYQRFSAQGVDRQKALKRSSNIKHELIMNGTSLQISPYYSFPKRDGMRDQHVEIVIEVPLGKALKINGLTNQTQKDHQEGWLEDGVPFEFWTPENQ